MIISVVDTETGDFTPEAEAVEIGVVRINTDSLTVLSTYTSLIKTNRPVTYEARAVHHIMDEELAKAPPVSEVACLMTGNGLMTGTGGYEDDVMSAHNMAFDFPVLTRTFPMIKFPTKLICTYRCALHLWPDAPSHKNQVLRYWRNIEVNPPGYPHRALYDAVVTAHLLCDMIRVLRIDQGVQDPVTELVKLTASPVLLTKLRFGKHSGVPAGQVPYSYWKWILGQDFDVDVIHTARHYTS